MLRGVPGLPPDQFDGVVPANPGIFARNEGICAGVVSAAGACTRPPQSSTPDSTSAARAERPPVASADSSAGLLGTEWRLEELSGAKALANVEATLMFPQAGRVAGKASCNRFAGPVEVRADSITFGALVTTRMACAEAINAQEASYVRALEGAQRFTISGTRLSIYSKGYSQPMTFVRTRPS